MQTNANKKHFFVISFTFFMFSYSCGGIPTTNNSFFEGNIKKKRGNLLTCLSRVFRLSHCPWNRISNAEAHAYGINDNIPSNGRGTLRYYGSKLNLRDSNTPQINAVTRLFNMSCHSYRMTLQKYAFFLIRPKLFSTYRFCLPTLMLDFPNKYQR